MKLGISIGVSLLLASVGCGSALERSAGENDAGEGGGAGIGGSSTNTGGSGAVGGELGTPPEWPELEGETKSLGNPVTTTNFGPAQCDALNPQHLEVLFDFVPADANASGSAVLAREALQQSRSPIPVHMRTQELLNYYSPRFGSNTGTKPEILVQLRPHAVVSGVYELLVGVEVPPLPAADRPPVALTLVVDTTQSMSGVLTRVQNAIAALAGGLRQGDVVRWVTSDPTTDPAPLAIGGADDSELLARSGALAADADDYPAQLNDLVARGMDLARSQVQAGSWNRLVVITDGEGELDATTHQAVKDAAMQDDILVLALGVGPALTSSPRMLRLLSHAGRGPYVHLDDGPASFLKDRFNELFGKAVDGVELGLRLPWYFEIERPYLFESTTTSTAETQYLAPGQVAAFPFRLTACDESVVDGGNMIDVTVRWNDPATGAPESVVAQPLVEELLGGSSSELAQVFAVLAYGDGLRTMDPTRLFRAHQLLVGVGNPTTNEIATLVQMHPAYPPQ